MGKKEREQEKGEGKVRKRQIEVHTQVLGSGVS